MTPTPADEPPQRTDARQLRDDPAAACSRLVSDAAGRGVGAGRGVAAAGLLVWLWQELA